LQTQEQLQLSKEEKEITHNAILATAIIFSFVGIFIYAIAGVSIETEKAKKAKSDEEYFSHNGAFICSSSPLLTSAKYLVSKNNGWEIYNTSYFQKEDLLIDFKSCNRTTEQ